MMPAHTSIHNFFKDFITNNPNKTIEILTQKGRFENLKMLNRQNWKIIRTVSEDPIWIPKNRRFGTVADYPQEQGKIDAGWLYQLRDFGSKALTVFEIKTGDFNINDILNKYVYSLFSESRIFYENKKHTYLQICGEIENPLYILAWHDKLVKNLPFIEDDIYIYLIKKGFIKVAPLEWFFNTIYKDMLDVGLAITDQNVRDKVELVELVTKKSILRNLPDYSEEWKIKKEAEKNGMEYIKISDDKYIIQKRRSISTLFDGF